MKTYDLDALLKSWSEAKEDERDAVERRRALEDEITKHLEVPESLDGVKNYAVGELTLKITGRLDRKVDGDKLQELAREHGLEGHLTSLFRWKPEVSVSAWKSADQKLIAPLMGAITTKPGRPSFAVVTKKEET